MKKKICKQCGKEFGSYPASKRIFCSRPCFRMSRRGKLIKPSTPCLICGNPVRRRTRNKCCSFKCAGIASRGRPSWNKGKKLSKEHIEKMRKAHLGSKHVLSTEAKISFRQKMSGENSPNWRGGITSFNKIERAKFRQKVQKQVFERDNYTCQICGIYGKQLQVDHIQSWKDYIEARFDLSNCRTLCMDCHYWITFHREKPKDVIWGHNLKHIFERRVD